MKTITMSDDTHELLKEILFHDRNSGNSYTALQYRKVAYLRDRRWRDRLDENKSLLWEAVFRD